MSTRRLERDLYLLQRGLGDIRTARRGPAPLAKRLVKRAVHRRIIGLLRRTGAW